MDRASLDPVSVLVLLAARVVSEEMSRIVGAYAVIWVASTIGAYFALGARDPSSPMTGSSSVAFFLAVNAVALLLTVPLAMLGASYLPASVDDRWLFAPMALGIGLVGDRWPRVGHAFAKWLRWRLHINGGPRSD
jgi:hypothetical protein